MHSITNIDHLLSNRVRCLSKSDLLQWCSNAPNSSLNSAFSKNSPFVWIPFRQMSLLSAHFELCISFLANDGQLHHLSHTKRAKPQKATDTQTDRNRSNTKIIQTQWNITRKIAHLLFAFQIHISRTITIAAKPMLFSWQTTPKKQCMQHMQENWNAKSLFQAHGDQKEDKRHKWTANDGQKIYLQ